MKENIAPGAPNPFSSASWFDPLEERNVSMKTRHLFSEINVEFHHFIQTPFGRGF